MLCLLHGRGSINVYSLLFCCWIWLPALIWEHLLTRSQVRLCCGSRISPFSLPSFHIPSTGDSWGTLASSLSDLSTCLAVWSLVGLLHLISVFFLLIPCSLVAFQSSEWWEKLGMGRPCFLLGFVCLAQSILRLKVTLSSLHSSIIALLCWHQRNGSFQPLIHSVWTFPLGKAGVILLRHFPHTSLSACFLKFSYI